MRARSLRVDNRATTSVTSNLVERRGVILGASLHFVHRVLLSTKMEQSPCE